LNFLKYHKKITLKCWVGVTAAILIGILIFGLLPKGFHISNGVSWITDQPGIRFDKYGIAYTDSFPVSMGGEIPESNSFSVEIALKPARYDEKRFNFILAFHNGKDRDQLLLGQWRSSIILMNGDDYAHKRRTKRIAVNMASASPSPLFLTITSGEEGTKVFLNGQLVRTKKNLTVKIPTGGNTRLIIGNSVYGRHSWQGDVYGLACYGYALTPRNATRHFNRWRRDRNFSYAKREKPSVLYFFDEKEGIRAVDQAGGNHHLEIPLKMHTLKREILTPARSISKFNRSFVKDIVLNLMGFIPLGLVLSITFIKLGGTFKKNNILISVGLCFTLSLAIEIAQAWIPSRSSHMLDLILNTLGGLIGTLIALATV
jgi:VanZ family protein